MNDHDDMISAVRASVDQLSKEENNDKAAPDKIEAAPDESASERARDEKGRFVASEATEQPEKIAAPETPVTPVAASTPQLKPPTSWPSEAQVEFSKLSPAVQQAVLKREDEMSKGSQQYSDERQRLRTLEGIIAPRREYYQRFGFKSDAEAINHLFTLSDSMERDAAGTLANLARHYGVDMARLSGGQHQIQPNQTPPVNIEQTVSEAVAMQFAKMTVAEFEQNAPEHYQEVKSLMQILLEKGQATDLQDAYDKAVWANPDIRTKVLEAKRAEEEQKRLATQTAKVTQKVKAANASLNGAPHGTPASVPKTAPRGAFGDVADDVRAAISSLM